MDRPHVQQKLPLHMFKNTSRLQCVIPNSLDPTPSSSSTISAINMDLRSSMPEPVAPPSSPTDPNLDHITSLERSLCSDFVCCGARLPDLHALLEHFEEDHIMVLAPNGKRVYPQEGLRAVPLHPIPPSLHTTPSSSRSSSVLSSPNSPPCSLSPSSPDPSSQSDLPSRLHGTFERRKSSITVAPVYTPFTPSLPVDPAYPYPDSPEIDMPLYDFSQDFYPTYSVQLPVSHFDDDEEISDTSATSHPTSPIPTYVYGPDKSHPIAEIPKTVRGATLDGLKSALKISLSKNNKAKNRQTNPGSSPVSSRRREKAYRCPTPRCTKSYLNPNGLKYHLEKGTCKIESDYESEAGDESNLLPTSPSPAAYTQSSSPSSTTRTLIQQQVTSPNHSEIQTQHGSEEQQREQQSISSSLTESGLNLSPEYHHHHHHHPQPSRQSHQSYQYPCQQYRPLYPDPGQVSTPSYSPATTPIAVSLP